MVPGYLYAAERLYCSYFSIGITTPKLSLVSLVF